MNVNYLLTGLISKDMHYDIVLTTGPYALKALPEFADCKKLYPALIILLAHNLQ